MKILASYVVLLLALVLSRGISPVNAEHQVYITVHCASKDTDLGTHKLTFGGNFHWSFNVNFWRTTLFYCDKSWDNVKGHFDVFMAKRDTHRCAEDECFWEVKKDGLYLYIWEHDAYEL
ncbi:S-protein homolog 5 [Morus notabilis]|uniref:S-protein homolog 5 n=1 Tax=Morus notabilis TaxID=981085 RepID=UPI000CED374F|nr:S-protein homolog 5 [Morus notabilis]